MIIKEPEKLAPEVLRSMLTALEYNRSSRDITNLFRELKTRMKGIFTQWTDDGNIVYGTLVVMFGDYGTSPRSGWFGSNRLKEELVKELERYEEEWVREREGREDQ